MRDICHCTGKSALSDRPDNFSLKSEDEISCLRDSAFIVRDLFIQLKKIVRAGMNELDISIFCENYILLRNAEPFLKSSGMFSSAVLISRNNKAFHGLPEDHRLHEGEIITVDVVLKKNGWFGDGAWTYEVGTCRTEVQNLVGFSRKIIYEYVDILRNGGSFRDAAEHLERRSTEEGFRVIGEGAGHGIGRDYHEEPVILFTPESSDDKVVPGMVFTVEPVITDYCGKLMYSTDGTAFVDPGYLSSQFEHMVAYGPEGLEILTDPLTLFK